MRKIVQIDDYRFSRADSRWERDKCPHKAIVLDDNGQTVECGDCGKELGAYWALNMLVHRWSDWKKNLASRTAEVERLEASVVVLKAAKSAEKAWRRTKTVPCCPHCKKAVLPTDGFGDSGPKVSKALEIQRRKGAK